MANLQFPHSSAPLRTIKEIQFGLLSPEEIKNMSVVHIEYPETMDDAKQAPREKGLNDPKLGSIDQRTMCSTCGESQATCPGHFGHIELAVPVFHIGFLTKIKKLLETVCHNCGKILVDESNPNYVAALHYRDPKRRFAAIHELCKPKLVCEMDLPDDDEQEGPDKRPKIQHGGCGNIQPEIRKEGLKLNGTYKFPKNEDEETKQPEKKAISPQMALEIFRNIAPEDVKKLGLSNDYARPEWMIITVLPVPPPPVRPSIVVGGGTGMRGEDDLTYKLGDIIRANGNVRRCISEGSPQHVQNEFESLLQFHVATYMDNNIAGQPQALQKSGRPVKAIRARLKGKEGRLRGNLMGKRVDFSARTVITGDPNLSLDEVGVPRSIAKTLTYPETVTPYNIQKLSQLVANGPNVHPGANYVFREDGERYNLKHQMRTGTLALRYGWKVERHIVDGDYIIFNRQPSLHKESMMGHRVRVMPFSTFRLNLSVTGPYNADFDGDEMNLHVPQSEETRAEILQLCMVPLNIVSPQRNGPLMGIVQDTLCGIYKICRRDVFLTQSQVMNIMMWTPDWDGEIPQPAILKPKPRWTGKQIISTVLPTGLNLLRVDKSGGMNPRDDAGLFVNNGELMFGMFKKNSVGATGGGIIHLIFNEKGPEAAVNFFNGAQQVVNYWLLHNGFSIGIGDTIADAPTVRKIQEAVALKKEEVAKITASATSNELEPLPGMNIRETFESKVTKELNDARSKAGEYATDGLRDWNNAAEMVRAGSKGSDINISQMTAVVGQQAVEGKRIPFGFKYRTLPHFTKDDYSPESRGFVENSYLIGLTPQEFFFHAMAGREGLIDTAVKTAETGYIQRRLVKALEDVMAKYDTTVRNSLGDIVQFVYGEDGLDAVHVEKQTVDLLACSNPQFDKKFKVDVVNSKNPLQDYLEQSSEIAGDVEVQRMLDEEYDQLLKDRDLLRSLQNVQAKDDEVEQELQIPLRVERMIESAKTAFRIKDGAKSNLHPAYAISRVRETLDNLIVINGEDEMSREAQESATLLVKAQLRSHLAFKRLVQVHSLNKLAFDNILGDIQNRFIRAQINPGEMVGVLAAQSIGEPATQMTLNTFHYAGVSSKNVTLGVPRLKEILNVATNIKTPSMMVYQEPKNKGDKAACNNLRSQVEHTTLRSVTETTEIYYDPQIQSTIVEADRDIVEAFYMIPEENVDDLNTVQSRWLLRLVLSRKKLLDKQLTAKDVATKIKQEFRSSLAVIYSEENDDEQVVRIRLVQVKEDTDFAEQDVALKKLESHLLENLTLRGVPGISRAFINSGIRRRINDEGKLIADKDEPICQEWFLETSGTSLRNVLQVAGTDPYRTYSNSFDEIFHVLGIEATRAALLRELTKILTFDGSYVNHRHMALLVDVMTARGFLMAITRHGINRRETGALARCTFEETVEILMEAAAVGELDDCKGVSENVILGQLAPIGTGELEVFLDQGMLNTATSDNAARLGIAPNIGAVGAIADGAATPYDMGSPLADGGYASPDYGASFSPVQTHGQDDTGGFTTYGRNYSDGGFASPYGGGQSPGRDFGATSPFSTTSPTSPGYSPSSPGMFSPVSPAGGSASPAFAITSPGFMGSPASPALGTPTSPAYSPASPGFTQGPSPTSPSYSPTSPNYSPTSPSYSPTSPSYSPTSPAMGRPTDKSFSPASPAYSPTSPNFTPGSGNPNHPQQSPTSPRTYSPTSPTSPNAYSPTSPKYSPTSPNGAYSASSPQYTPTSPTYSPTSPRS